MKNTQKKDTTMPNAHLHELFMDELKDILGAERQLLKGLKKMESSAKSDTLKTAIHTHYQETQGQIERLRQVFESLGASFRSKKCKAMEGLLNEAEEIIESFEDEKVIDAAIIAAAQKVEHYEIATYGTLATYASLMKHDEVAELLKATLEEEKATDSKLTEVAMQESNMAA